MKRRISTPSPCERVIEWSLERRYEPFPAELQKHSDCCPDCQAFLTQEKWILTTVQNQAKLAPTGLSPNQFARVFSAIQETSDRLSVPAKQLLPWRRALVALVTSFAMILTGFWFLPLFQGETYVASTVNRKMRALLQYQAPSIEAVSVEQADQTLQFASRYFTSNEEKTFYFSNDHFSYEELLWIRWLVQKTRAQYDRMAEDYQMLSPARLLYKYHLSSHEAVTALKSLLDEYRQSVVQADITVDGVVERIDYFNNRIWLDTMPESVIADLDWLNLAKIHQYVQVKLSKQDQEWHVVQILESDFCSTILQGKLSEVGPATFSLQDNPVMIEWNSRTVLSAASLEDLLHKLVKVRVVQDQTKSIALTVREQIEPKKRTMTGYIDTAYQSGFIMKDLHQSFLLSSALQQNPMELDKKFSVSVTGEDYGAFFIVQELVLIAPPVENTGLLLAAAPSVTIPAPRQKDASITRKVSSTRVNVESHTSPDWIVGIRDQHYLLASGETIAKAKNVYPIGSKITKATDSTKQTSILSGFINDLIIVRTEATLVSRLNNGVYVFVSDQQKKILYYTETSLPYINQKVQIQARAIEYPELIVLLEGRLFQSSHVKKMTSLVVREMEHEKVFLLENGVIIRLDALSFIQNGPISVGKMVTITGVEEHNSLTAYTIEVQREFAIFTGKITEINQTEKWCRIDSGKQFYWTTEAQFSLLLQAFNTDKPVYCKAYYENQVWKVESLSFSQGESGDKA